MAFLVAEDENRELKDLPHADLGCVTERFLLLVRPKSVTENFVCWKLCPLFVLYCFNTFFSPTDFSISIQGFWILLFSFIKVVFLVSKGLLCLYGKQNKTWLLLDMEFLFACSTWHLTCSLCSLMSFQVKHSKRSSTSTYMHVLFSI